MIERQLTSRLQYAATKFPFVTITGPRQSGKSTIARMAFPDYRSVSLEDLDMREFAQTDPRGFINTFPGHVIIDEVQRVPSILSYLQTYTDEKNQEGMYILTGSQNGLLMQSIDQSLAGRTSLNSLLPLSVKELSDAGIAPTSINGQIFQGGYPRIFAKDIAPTDFFPSYISTYVERDVRQILNIGDLDKFVLMLKLCSGRIGQLLNKSSLAVEVGVTVPTIDSWLSVLQASYIVYLLQPYHDNFSKRLTKTPKLYFYDTGLACSLLGINDSAQIDTHFLRGGLFENLVINELMKWYFNNGIKPALWFWRDSTGNEIDIIDTTNTETALYEIKSGMTVSANYTKGFKYWAKNTDVSDMKCRVIYAGQTYMDRSDCEIIPWQDFCKFKTQL